MVLWQRLGRSYGKWPSLVGVSRVSPRAHTSLSEVPQRSSGVSSMAWKYAGARYDEKKHDQQRARAWADVAPFQTDTLAGGGDGDRGGSLGFKLTHFPDVSTPMICYDMQLRAMQSIDGISWSQGKEDPDR